MHRYLQYSRDLCGPTHCRRHPSARSSSAARYPFLLLRPTPPYRHAHRTAAECVVFFYKNQKSDDFAIVRRKQQLKKRRQQAESRRLYGATGRVAMASSALPAPAMSLPVGLPAGGGAGDAPEPPAAGGGGSGSGPGWTDEEFLEAVRLHGRDWVALSNHLSDLGHDRATVKYVRWWYARAKRRVPLDDVADAAEAAGEEAELPRQPLSTKFTSRPGTATTFTTCRPASCSAIFGSAATIRR